MLSVWWMISGSNLDLVFHFSIMQLCRNVFLKNFRLLIYITCGETVDLKTRLSILSHEVDIFALLTQASDIGLSLPSCSYYSDWCNILSVWSFNSVCEVQSRKILSIYIFVSLKFYFRYLFHLKLCQLKFWLWHLYL